ncbi:MAG: hypothetical protein V8S95_04310 [Odoribacter sp.]
MEENDEMFGKKVVMDPGDSDRVKAGQIITARTLRGYQFAIENAGILERWMPVMLCLQLLLRCYKVLLVLLYSHSSFIFPESLHQTTKASE